jgi:hypothetical protein
MELVVMVSDLVHWNKYQQHCTHDQGVNLHEVGGLTIIHKKLLKFLVVQIVQIH